MQRTHFDDLPCPVARSLERVGEWWSILILRDAFQGLSRFDEFQQSLQLSPTMLTRRLKHLVASGILERHLYHARPARYEYRLTQRGIDFFPVLAAMFDWGNKHLAPEGAAVILVDRHSGEPIQPQLLDQRTQRPILYQDVTIAAGPVSSDIVKRRLALMREKASARSIESE